MTRETSFANHFIYCIKNPFLSVSVGYSFANDKTHLNYISPLKRAPRASDRQPPKELRVLIDELTRWLSDASTKFTFKPDLSGFPEFDRNVYRAVIKIPPGKVLSYGETAIAAGYPRAARAVGNAMRKNRFMLLIPCHRVVASNGIGGYGGTPEGVELKRMLLSREGVIY